MTTLLYPATLTPGSNENVNDLNSILSAIAAWANGNIDSTNLLDGGVSAGDLSAVLQQQLGTSGGATTGRGKSIIAATESRSNVAYGTLTTPDQVTGIVLPTDGLIAVAYQATWQSSALHAGFAAIFVGANQLKLGQNNLGAPANQEAAVDNNAAVDQLLATGPTGLIGGGAGAGATAYIGDVTTGQVIGNNSYAPGGGGPVYIFAAAGTYTVSVQFKATSGSVTAKNRKLWVWTLGF